MSEWKTPVYDRTIDDVKYAAEKIKEWREKGSSVSKEITDLKGCLNLSDINRIEGNIDYLARLLESYQYNTGAVCKEWTERGLPDETDISRIIDNVRSMIDVFCQNPNAPALPQTLTSYQHINDVEENLLMLKELLDIMVTSFKKSGTFNSGSTTFLPIRR